LIGKSLAHYSILDKLGEGGMGVVYKARDTHLDRFVAIKLLAPDWTADPERRRRFILEAKAASALNHPNIIVVHDIASDNGVDFIVMEHVAGKTLQQLIPRKGMPLNEALKIAIQIAAALARAQSAGIVHRDLKPSNVMVDDHGLVKVLDFGLAKLTEVGPVTGKDTTRTVGLETQEGVVVGTAAYMSPEQAEGKFVDSRSDVFSFGAVLYEMVTGHPAFQRDSRVSTLCAVLREEPKRLGEFPVDLEKIIGRCLRKDPDRRWQTLADLKVALREVSEETSSQPAGAMALPVKRYRLRLLAALLVLLLLAAVGWSLYKYAGRKVPLPALVQLTSYSGSERYPSFSPDGSQVAFAWDGENGENSNIYVKLLGDSNALRLTTDPAPEFWPAWSPDGKRIAFQRGEAGAPGIWFVSPLGGSPQKIADVSASGQMSWSPDGKWLAVGHQLSSADPGNERGLLLVAVGGGEPRRLSSPKAPAFDVHPTFSPVGRLMAYASCTSEWSCDVFVQELDSGYSPMGNPRRITRQGLFVGGLAWSPDGGSLVYSGAISWGMNPRLWRVGVKNPQPARLDLAGFMAVDPSVAAQGGRLAFSRRVANYDIWRYQLGGTPGPFLASSLHEWNPQFSPDGRRIAFASGRSSEAIEIWTAAADGSHPAQLTRDAGRGQGTPRWSPDGRLIAFDSLDQDGQSHIYVIDANGGLPRPVTSGSFSDHVPSWSRDGKWIYYFSNRTGRNETWRIPFGQGSAQQITSNGGDGGFESTDGKTFYYMKDRDSALFSRTLAGGPERQVLPNVSNRAFDVFEDGIYYIGQPQTRMQYSIQFYNFSTKVSSFVSRVEGPLQQGLSVSPDRKTILFSKSVPPSADLMIIENFR
jgi:eukaryotic-like serine/threonine-protein kinase